MIFEERPELKNTIKFVQSKLKDAEAGHNWLHIERVCKLANIIADKEGGDRTKILLIALLHDVVDSKFYQGNEQEGFKMITHFLENEGFAKPLITTVLDDIQHLSFRNHQDLQKERTIEFKIVQDADRLDALGAIGIARTFHFGGYKNNPIYDPSIPYQKVFNKEEYKKSIGTTINHFYEKLLLLKDQMNTSTARDIAEERHQFMLTFLEQFYKEWHIDKALK